jgi:hypothetical protein
MGNALVRVRAQGRNFDWRDHVRNVASPHWRRLLDVESRCIVAPIHAKAMPVILTSPDEIETWLAAPKAEVLKLQRPLRDAALRIVTCGAKTGRRRPNRKLDFIGLQPLGTDLAAVSSSMTLNCEEESTIRPAARARAALLPRAP